VSAGCPLAVRWHICVRSHSDVRLRTLKEHGLISKCCGLERQPTVDSDPLLMTCSDSTYQTRMRGSQLRVLLW
jgi:hypothetical protein